MRTQRTTITFSILAALGAFAIPAGAHRLDEYLQAILVSMSENDLNASMRLIPGVAVSPAVIAAADSNHDGVFSPEEQKRYAQIVLNDLSLRVDGRNLTPILRTITFPTAAEMKGGLGEIHLEFAAQLPGGKSYRALTIENHHRPDMSVYLMNCLVPQDRNIRVIAQKRSANQAFYRIDYLQKVTGNQSLHSWWSQTGKTALAAVNVMPRMFRLGMHHIADGTDHLLFLLALLLPAPLSCKCRLRWSGPKGVRRSLAQIVRVVTAFTIGHSLTLALGASGLLSLPHRLVEVLIAVSIFISAIHALRPLFPGREPLLAGGFGLIHGLAFAATLQNLGVDAWGRAASVLGFNIGIETMQLIVVTATLPSLLLLSRTGAYSFFRITGALLACFASAGWMVERTFDVDCSIDRVVNGLADHGFWLAAGFFIFSLVWWLCSRKTSGERTLFRQAQPLGSA